MLKTPKMNVAARKRPRSGRRRHAGSRTRTLAARFGMLQVEHIVVHGNERLSKGEVMGMLDGLRGESLFGAAVEEVRRFCACCRRGKRER